MTFQPTTWILVFVTLFVGFIAQGCDPSDGGDGGAKASQSRESDNTGVQQPNEGDRVGDGDGAGKKEVQSSTPAHKDAAQWIRGTLMSNGVAAVTQTVDQVVANETECMNICFRWCLCEGAAWTGEECNLSIQDDLTVDRADDAVPDEDEDAATRRMLYGTAPAKAKAELVWIWIRPRCGDIIPNTQVSSVVEATLVTNETADGEEMSAQDCRTNCSGTPGCVFWVAHTTTEEKTTGAYAKKKNSTKCRHYGGTGSFLHRGQMQINPDGGGDSSASGDAGNASNASDGSDPSDSSDGSDASASVGGGASPAYFESGRTCLLVTECSEEWLEDHAFQNLYSNELNATVIEGLTREKCRDECKPGKCAGATFRENTDDSTASMCWLASDENVIIPDAKATFAAEFEGFDLTLFVFSAYKPTFGRPLFEQESQSRTNTPGGPAVGAIIGGALAAVAVAVLAFVGFRAYKKHKGADAENAAETGSVATSSPKSARKRQAIE